ncbi:MAG: restriction endonuclease subunit S [Anaerolineales bacterium]|nr:restriction endonuclease subunit S [Anaerolineales bacterium]
MQKYPAYKDSGIKWLDEIPCHWEMRKVSRSFRLIGSGTTPASGNSQFYENGTINWINTGDLNDSVLFSCSKKVSQLAFDTHSTLKLYPVGTLLIAMYGATIGKVATLGIEACTNQACCALADSDYFNIEFVKYWFLGFRQFIVQLSYGGGQPNISQDTIRSLKIPSPPLEEQAAVVAFLEEQTAVINQFLTNKRRLIELLEEQKQVVINTAVTQGLETAVARKPSGIDWLGDIPSHWESLQIKRCLQKYEYGISASLSGSGRYKVLTMGHIQDGQVIIPDEGCLEEKPDLILDNGDLLFNRTNSPELVGKVGLFRGNASHEISFASYLVRLKPREDVVPEYLNYLLNSSTFINSARQNALVSLHQANLNPTKYSRMLIPMPSHDEQLKIVKFIDDKTAEINAAIERTQREIELIEEYRTTLIAHAVTGKIDVRSVV